MELLDSKTIRSEGAKAGLVFGTISGGYIFLSLWVSGMGDVGGIIDLILRLGKIIGLVFLMRHYMIALNTIYDEVDWRQTFRFGLYTVLFSALITASCAYIAYAYVFPASIHDVMETARQMIGSNMDSNTARSFNEMENDFPTYAFFSLGLWCLVYGIVLSFILARTLPEGTMGEDEEEEEDEDEDEDDD